MKDCTIESPVFSSSKSQNVQSSIKGRSGLNIRHFWLIFSTVWVYLHPVSRLWGLRKIVRDLSQAPKENSIKLPGEVHHIITLPIFLYIEQDSFPVYYRNFGARKCD